MKNNVGQYFRQFIKFFKSKCFCCGTTNGVSEHGYAETNYCDHCAVAKGYRIYTDEQLMCHCKGKGDDDETTFQS